MLAILLGTALLGYAQGNTFDVTYPYIGTTTVPYASGSSTTTTTSGSTPAGSTSVTVASGSSFAVGQGIYIAGAGSGIGGTIAYSSGGSATGAGTCVAVPTSGGLAVATVGVSSGTISGNLTVQNTGTSYSTMPTTWTLSLGTSTTTVGTAGTCSGTITTTGGTLSTTQYIGTITSATGNTLIVTPATSTTVSSGTLVQHDESAAFQLVINALGTTGGTIFVPNGTYNMNWTLQDASGANAILKMPTLGSAAVVPNIEIRGLTAYSEAAVALTNGAFLQTTTASGNFIGGAQPGGGGFTYVKLALRKLILRSYPNPGVTMVNAQWLCELDMEGVMVDTGDSGSGTYLVLTQPTNTNGIGIVTPAQNNYAFSVIRTTTTRGYYIGIEWSEHTYLDYTISGQDYIAYYFYNSTAHALYGSRVAAVWCPYVLYTNGSSDTVQIGELDIEDAISAMGWVAGISGGDIYDPSNNLNGAVDYSKVISFDGNGNPLSLTGAAGLQLVNLGIPYASRLTEAVAYGTAPTCTMSFNSVATNCYVATGGNDNRGVMFATAAGGGTASTWTLTLHAALGANQVVCGFWAQGPWAAPVSLIVTSGSVTGSASVSITNGAAFSATGYAVNYDCGGT